MARRDIPTDVIGTSHLVREYTNLNFEECYPITTTVTKTVGAGKDFETFHEAMVWACNTTIAGAGNIDLLLDDGTHVIPMDALDEYWWAFYTFRNNNIGITGASHNKANCIITLEGVDDGDREPGIFQLLGTAHLWLAYITLDVGAGGYPYPESVGVAWCSEASKVSIVHADIVCGSPIWVGDIAIALVGSSILTGSQIGLETILGGTIHISGPTELKNFATGIKATLGGRVRQSAGVVTFTNCITDTNIPLNQIQYDGSYISNGAAALSFKP